MVNFIIWLIVGVVIGGLGKIVLRRSSLPANMVLGVIGAVAAGYLLPAFLQMGTARQVSFSLPALVLSAVGAVILVGGNYFLHRKRVFNDKAIEANWPLVRKKIHVRWDRITEEDIEQINGNHARFIKVLQDRYHYDEKKAEADLQSYLRALI